MYDYGYYDYGYDYGYETAATGLAGLAIFSVIMWIISMGVAVFSIVCMWKVFTKAGKPGWAAIVPIYNIIVMLEIAELPMWYIALFFVPFANIYAMFKIYIEIAHKFGKSTGFGVGMVFLAPIFFAILAFGKDSVYGGAQVSQQQVMAQPMVAPVQQPVMPEPTVEPVQQPVMSEPTVAPVQQPVMSEPVVEPVQQPVMPEPVVEPVQQPQFCTSCGSQTIPGSKFCVKCGKQL